ncbi:hypothetical protein ABZ876_22425 [Streptomyces sp. NPDC046931]|uniref:hypothetical protein n=1 Tax=Streptomyces sp. NPDC046931 TaxID=3154806 RepID=UPI0033D657DA
MFSRTPAGWGTACAVLLLSLAACTTGHSDAGPSRAVPERSSDSAVPGEATARVTATATATATAAAERPSFRAPELGDGETLAGRQEPTRGNASFELGTGRKGDALLVGVRCEGRGRMYVAVRSVDASFSVDCRAGRVGSYENELALTGADRRGTVAVEAPPAVRWSVTVGRGAPAPKGPAGPG